MKQAMAMWAMSLFVLAAAAGTEVVGQQGASDGARYDADGMLLYPSDYREWVYVTSGLGMTYGPAAQAEGRPPLFDNVFVNRESYRSFLATGQWPERTIFVLEIRSGEEHVSINNGGRTQGAIRALEVAVKDRARFADTTWGYFEFGAPPKVAPASPRLPRRPAAIPATRTMRRWSRRSCSSIQP
jgi:hypothetical protein